MTEIVSLQEHSRAPYYYGVPGWSKYREEPGGWSWIGVKDDQYGLETTLFLTGPILKDTQLTIRFTIEEITFNNLATEVADVEGFPNVGVYFSYLDRDDDAIKYTYCREAKEYSFIVDQKAAYWPTANVTSTTGIAVPYVDLQQFYNLPSISMGSANRCVIGEVSVDSVPFPEPPSPEPELLPI